MSNNNYEINTNIFDLILQGTENNLDDVKVILNLHSIFYDIANINIDDLNKPPTLNNVVCPYLVVLSGFYLYTGTFIYGYDEDILDKGGDPILAADSILAHLQNPQYNKLAYQVLININNNLSSNNINQAEENSKIFFKEIEPFIREYIINNFFNTIANYSVIWNMPVNKEEDAILVAEKFTTMQKDEYKKNILNMMNLTLESTTNVVPQHLGQLNTFQVPSLISTQAGGKKLNKKNKKYKTNKLKIKKTKKYKRKKTKKIKKRS